VQGSDLHRFGMVQANKKLFGVR